MLDLFFTFNVGFVEAFQRVHVLGPLMFDQLHDSEATLSQELDDLEIVELKPLLFTFYGYFSLICGAGALLLRQQSISAARHKMLILCSIFDGSTAVEANLGTGFHRFLLVSDQCRLLFV